MQGAVETKRILELSSLAHAVQKSFNLSNKPVDLFWILRDLHFSICDTDAEMYLQKHLTKLELHILRS